MPVSDEQEGDDYSFSDDEWLEINVTSDDNPYGKTKLLDLIDALENSDGEDEYLNNTILYHLSRAPIDDLIDQWVEDDIMRFVGLKTEKVDRAETHDKKFAVAIDYSEQYHRKSAEAEELYKAILNLGFYQHMKQIGAPEFSTPLHNRRWAIESLCMRDEYVFLEEPRFRESLHKKIEEYGIDDVPAWRAEVIYHYKNASIVCDINWLLVVLFDHALTAIQEAGGKDTMTLAKREQTREQIIMSRKQKLINGANKQIAILKRYEETKEYEKAAMNNNWLLIRPDGITVIPRIGAYPVMRTIKNGIIVQQGGTGWACATPGEAIKKIQGFIVNLKTTMYDNEIYNMFDPITKQEARLLQKNGSKRP